jgi:hypothetical protein
MVKTTIVGLSLFLVGCDQPQMPDPQPVEDTRRDAHEADSTFNKKVRCLELKSTLQRDNQPWQVDSVFYSPILNTCVLTKTLLQKDATVFVIEDALTGASIFVDRNINGKSLDEITRRVDELRNQVSK